jgi:hypothetical protein
MRLHFVAVSVIAAIIGVTPRAAVSSEASDQGGALEMEPIPPSPDAIGQAWRSLPSIRDQGCTRDLIFDYGNNGGMRNFFCRALKALSWKAFLTLAGVAPFKSGPHQQGRLDLANARAFGAYDPRFVRWAVENLVPAANDAALRAETQPAYDAMVKKLARTYFVVHAAITSNPQWLKAEARTYLAAARSGHGGWDQPTVDLYHDVLGRGGDDPNLVRSATMWWLRRYDDGTMPLWLTGLEKLLTTYDGAWLTQEKQEGFRGRLPRRAAVPEYRQ